MLPVLPYKTLSFILNKALFLGKIEEQNETKACGWVLKNNLMSEIKALGRAELDD